MKIIKVNAGKEPEIAEIDGSLESMQAVVGGLIEVYDLGNQDNIVIVCNEEGKCNGSHPNRAIIREDGRIEDIIFGDFFLCQAPPDSESLLGVPENKLREYLRRFSL